VATFDLRGDGEHAPASGARESTDRKDRRLAPGDVLGGKYRVERLVGEGGMGQVLAATHLGLGQEVAIKIMLAEKATESDSVERFLREARAAVMLKSSHVARVFDVATTDTGLPYIVMELLDGKDLVTILLESGALPYADAVDVLVQVCDAVAEAHSLGIIHRDLKPENFFLSRRRDGTPHVKVLDFGISKLGAESTTTKGRRLVTQENTVLGSPTYMSPEQVKNSKRVDERSDIWSLGVSLYELLTASEPFGADTIPEIFVNVLTTTPATPDQVVAGIPPELSAIVMRCLEKEPSARFQNVGELANALARYGTGKVTSVAPTWGEKERAPDSSSSLVSRLSVPTPPPFQPMLIASSTTRMPQPATPPPMSISSRAPMGLSATIAEAPPPKSSRALGIGLSVAAAALLLVAGAGTAWWKLHRAHAITASAAATPSGEAGGAGSSDPAAAAAAAASPATSAAAAAPASDASPSPPLASAEPTSPRPAASTTSTTGRSGKPGSPRTFGGARPAASSATAAPKSTGLPRERTSW
jgi:serine/threonine-protein kinase